VADSAHKPSSNPAGWKVIASLKAADASAAEERTLAFNAMKYA
jgi:hypothetical protein